MRSMLLIFIFVLFTVSPALAGPPHTGWSSLEWMVDETPFIVRGKIIDAKRLPSDPQTPLWAIEDMIVKVSEVFKGQVANPFINVRRLHKIRTSATQWRVEESDLIFFLKKAEQGSAFLFQYELPLAPINLDHLSENILALANFEVIRDREEILKIIKKRAGITVDMSLSEKAKDVAVPQQSEVYRALCSKSECSLRVPAELVEQVEKNSRGAVHDKKIR